VARGALWIMRDADLTSSKLRVVDNTQLMMAQFRPRLPRVRRLWRLAELSPTRGMFALEGKADIPNPCSNVRW
jgi:hypothetical protein